ANVAGPLSQAPSPYSRWHHMYPRRCYVEPFDELALREFRDRDHRSCRVGGVADEPASPGAFGDAEPFRVRDEREIVNGDDDRSRQPERRRVGRCKPDIESVGVRGARQRDLLPPCPARSSDNASAEPARIQRQTDWLRRV